MRVYVEMRPKLPNMCGGAETVRQPVGNRMVTPSRSPIHRRWNPRTQPHGSDRDNRSGCHGWRRRTPGERLRMASRSPTESTRDVAERWSAALTGGDIETALSCLSDDVEWINYTPVP